MVELAVPAVVAPHAAAGAASRADAMPELWTTWMTCVTDGREHAVTDEQVAAGWERGRGTYSAVCGQTITPQAMTCAPGPRCAACCTVLRAWCDPPRKAVWWLRWLRWLRRVPDADRHG